MRQVRDALMLPPLSGGDVGQSGMSPNKPQVTRSGRSFRSVARLLWEQDVEAAALDDPERHLHEHSKGIAAIPTN